MTTKKTVTVIWKHPSIRFKGAGYGEPVEMAEKDAATYRKKKWVEDPPTPDQEAPDAEGDPDGG